MTMIFYAAISIAFLLVIFALLAKTGHEDPEERMLNPDSPNMGNGSWLDLSERIFDPSDVRWLREELGFPKLAEALILQRKSLAIRWLETLQASFDEFVRTPELTSGEISEANSFEGWEILWLTLRFKFLISYALLMVRLFGPYHRLAPSFSWFPFPAGSVRRLRRTALANSGSTHEP
jgi:hypothetical protein